MLTAVKPKPKQYLWTNAFLRKLNQTANDMDLLNDRWFTGSYILSGIRCLLELGHDMNGLTYEKAQEQTDGRQSIVHLIFSAMASLTPRQFVSLFPIIKEYSGKKWQCKDYFYTRDYLRKINMDKPIGDKLYNFLWEYHNNLIREYVVYGMGIIDDMLKLQGKETIGEQWADKTGMDLYYEHTNEATGQKYLQSRNTGRTISIETAPNLKVVK